MSSSTHCWPAPPCDVAEHADPGGDRGVEPDAAGRGHPGDGDGRGLRAVVDRRDQGRLEQRGLGRAPAVIPRSSSQITDGQAGRPDQLLDRAAAQLDHARARSGRPTSPTTRATSVAPTVTTPSRRHATGRRAPRARRCAGRAAAAGRPAAAARRRTSTPLPVTRSTRPEPSGNGRSVKKPRCASWSSSTAWGTVRIRAAGTPAAVSSLLPLQRRCGRAAPRSARR